TRRFSTGLAGISSSAPLFVIQEPIRAVDRRVRSTAEWSAKRRRLVMADLSRRSFLGASAVAAAGAAVVAVPIASAAASPQAPAAPESLPLGGPGQATGPLMVWVSDARSGDFSVLVGAREVTHHDPDLVARLARVAGRNA